MAHSLPLMLLDFVCFNFSPLRWASFLAVTDFLFTCILGYPL